MNKENKTIGILGGMGPSASADLYYKIIKYSQENYGAVQDHEYPPVVLVSLAMLGFNETGVVDENLVESQLIDGVKKLEAAGADFIIIACNTVHIFYQQMQSAVKIPILNIIEETKKKVLQEGFKKIGLFSSETTNKLHLYQNSFEKSGIEVISANSEQQKLLNNVIENVMGGKHSPHDAKILKEIANDFQKKGAEAIVMGCTEIPLAADHSIVNIKLFDSTQILAESSVELSLNK